MAEEHGPESVVFSLVSPEVLASGDSVLRISHLMNAFETPSLGAAVELFGIAANQPIHTCYA